MVVDQLRVIAAFVRKDVTTALTYRAGFVLSQTGPIYGVVLFYFISRVVGTSPSVGDADGYFQFVVIGIALGDVMRTAASAAAVAARRDQIQGTLENLMAEPVPLITLGLAWTAYPLIDAFLRVVLTVAAAIPLGLASANLAVLPLLVTLLLTAFAFVAFGLIGAALVIAFQQGSGLVSMVLGLMALLSGALFPVSVMPSFLQSISTISPLRYAYEAARSAALHGAGLGDISGDLLVLLLFGLTAVPISLVLMSGASRYARQRGRLASF